MQYDFHSVHLFIYSLNSHCTHTMCQANLGEQNGLPLHQLYGLCRDGYYINEHASDAKVYMCDNFKGGNKQVATLKELTSTRRELKYRLRDLRA